MYIKHSSLHKSIMEECCENALNNPQKITEEKITDLCNLSCISNFSVYFGWNIKRRT